MALKEEKGSNIEGVRQKGRPTYKEVDFFEFVWFVGID